MNYKIPLEIWLVGFAILGGAIILNICAQALGITTWYGLIAHITQSSLFEAIKKESLISLLFLFLVYPLLLGIICYYAVRYIL